MSALRASYLLRRREHILTFMPKNYPIDPRLEQYLLLCQRMYERKERDGTWPWKSDIPQVDSTLSGKVVDSDSNA